MTFRLTRFFCNNKPGLYRSPANFASAQLPTTLSNGFKPIGEYDKEACSIVNWIVETLHAMSLRQTYDYKYLFLFYLLNNIFNTFVEKITMNIKKLLKYTFIPLFLTFTTSCSDNYFAADVSNIEVDLKIERFDKEIKTFNIENADSLKKIFEKKYSFFYEIFNQNILQIGQAGSPGYSENFYNFVLYNKSEGIFDEVDKIFGDFSQQQEQIKDLFKHYKYYFPQDTLPIVVTFLSGFNHSVITAEKYLGIALDKYLGAKSRYYDGADLYLRKRMDKKYLLVDIAAALSDAKYSPAYDSPNLFQKIIYEGKKQYFINSLLPQTHDSIRWIYTAKQLDWAERNENNIWNHLQEASLLFSNDRMKIRQYTEIAPFTIPLSDVSAPRAANYVGYKIVLSYMKNNPKLSLIDLMVNNDYQSILAGANYHP